MTKEKSPQSEIRELAMRHAPAALARLAALVESADDRLAFSASQEILNRAYGKPESAREATDGGTDWTVVVVRGDRGEALPARPSDPLESTAAVSSSAGAKRKRESPDK